MGALTRRQLLGAGLGAVAAGMLAGCAAPGTTSVNSRPTIPPATGGPITLTYWAWLKDLQKVADVWNARNPDVQVEAVWIPGGNAGGYQKLYSALAAGGGPDIAQVEMRSIPEFMLVDGLVDLGRYGAAEHAEKYDPTLWGQVSFGDGVYAIPQDSGPMAWYYQQPALEQIGAEPPATWDDWLALAREMRAAGSYLDTFPIGDASVFAMYATQAGASWLRAGDDGWEIDMADDATLEVADFWDRVVDEDLVTTAYGNFSPAWFAAAADGGIAAVTGASWADALIQGVAGGEGRWRVAPMPVWPGRGYGSSYQGGSTAAVLANSRHPREAMEFAVWMTTSPEGIDAMIEHSGIGWSPAAGYIGAQRERPSEFFSGQSYNTEVFVPAARDQNPDWVWWPITQQSFNILSDGFRRKASGQTFVESVREAEAQITSVFRNKGLRIRKAGS
ncbi:ABC transporter substrate-binding protein [Microbacterium sp. NPDC055683]